MKPLSACASIVGIADTGLRMVIRELLITLKLRDIEYVSDTDTLLQTFQHKPGVDLIIMQHDLPPGGGCLDVAKSVRWGKMSPNRNVPIVTVGRDWTPQKLVDVREAGINEVIAMPTAMQTVQRKLTSALDPERPFVSVDDYRGPSRRRRTTGHQGPFRRAADRIAEQLHDVEDKSARRTEKLEKLAAARPPEERPPLSAPPSSLPSRRPEPALEIPAEAKFLAQGRLNDFDGKSKGAHPPQSQRAPSPRTEYLGRGRPPPASSTAAKPPAPPVEHDSNSATGISATSEEAEVSPPPIPSAPLPSKGLSNPKESPSAASSGSEPPPPAGTIPSPCPPAPTSCEEAKPTKAPPNDTEPPVRQPPTAPSEPPMAPASEDPTLPQKADPSPTPPLRPSPDDISTEPKRPTSSTNAGTANPVGQALASDTGRGDEAQSPSPAAHQSEGNGISQSANSAHDASMATQLPAETSSPALPAGVTPPSSLPPSVAPATATARQESAAPPPSLAPDPFMHHEAGPSHASPLEPIPPLTMEEHERLAAVPADAAGAQNPFSQSQRGGKPPVAELEPATPARKATVPTDPATQPVSLSGLPPISVPAPSKVVGSQTTGGDTPSNVAVTEETPTIPMTQADLFKMLTSKKKKP
ncbi:hypothetical protein MCP1_430017 [Candidatus Terasakiella magnetica]|nr:hypothetical protein MCP1_430017 [Candidatus Terasakiella magnetica]